MESDRTIWISCDSRTYGPYTIEEIRRWINEGRVSADTPAFREGSQSWATLASLGIAPRVPPAIPPIPQQPPPPFPQGRGSPGWPVAPDRHRDETMVSRIGEYEKISGILWIVLGILQCLTIVGILAGVWNIFAGISRTKAAPAILGRGSNIPAMYEDYLQLIVIGVINVLLGGVIGVLFVAFDFYIRDLILSNRHLFQSNAGPAAA